jgi:glycosyltransferase involved in cell wall biosynthesis
VHDLWEDEVHSPAVSVIMAVRDGQQWLQHAVDSILTQTFSNFELLIIDDGSSDKTPNILADYRARDRRVIVIPQAREGLVRALNRGLARARAPFVARLDADDVALPQRLQHQLSYFEERPKTNLLGTWAQVIDGFGRPKRLLRPAVDGRILLQTLARTNPFIHSSVMFRTVIARKLGGYHLPFEAAEDYDLWLRFSEIGDIAILPEVLIQYRRHISSVTARRAVTQVFSVRLAKQASEARRQARDDPSSMLAAPPDWRIMDERAFYADTARLCRTLELADSAVAQDAASSSIDLDIVSRRIPNLTGAERKLAQMALINLISSRTRVPNHTTHSLLALLFRLHPTRALNLLWQSKRR